MRLPDFQYVEPESIEAACSFLKDHGRGCKLIGGGTDLLPSMKQRIFKPEYLLHLGGISTLNRMEFDKEAGLRIGPLVKLRSLEKDPLVLEKYPVLSEASAQIGSIQLRQMGTVGGNLSLDTRCYYYNQSDFWRSCRPKCIKMGGEKCNALGGGKKCFAVFSGDLAPVLIALDAKITLTSYTGERTLPLNDFYSGDGARPFALSPEEIITDIVVPPIPKDAFTSYLKYRIRKAVDFPVASVAVKLTLEGKEKVCRGLKVVIGAVGAKPSVVKGVGELMEGKRMEGSLIEKASELAFQTAKPIQNTASSPAHRKRMIKVFVESALTQALG
jgi:4-hydroxybenzoyl-CoA reductase subunit beta